MAEVVAEVNAGARRDHESAMDALRNQGLVFSQVDKANLEEWRSQSDLAGRELVDGGYISVGMHEALLDAIADFRAAK